MYRAGDLMKPPWDDPTAASWRVYADMLQDCGEKRQKEWLQALRYALGLTRRPKLVLVAYDVLDHRRYRFFQCGNPNWSSQAFTNWRWWTPRYAEPLMDIEFADGRGFIPLEKHLATPLDYPIMTDPGAEVGARLCKEFVRRATEAVGRLQVVDGEVHELRKLSRIEHRLCRKLMGNPGVGKWVPLNWEAEHASR